MAATQPSIAHRQDNLFEISKCEVCGNANLVPALDLGLHAMCDDLIPVGNPRVCEKYPISILFCDICRTAHQRYQVPKRQLFPTTYHYRANLTADVTAGLRDLVASVIQQRGSLSGKKVLDVGCNDGSLLSIFKEHGAVTFGIEPTDAAIEARANGHAVAQEFFDTASAAAFKDRNGSPDIISFTNVFAHIEDLQEVIAALNRLMTRDTLLVIENHYLGSVLQGNQFDTFYHEHPRTYSFTSFRHIARALSSNIAKLEFPRRYGGNIRVSINRRGDQPTDARDLRVNEDWFRDALLQMSKRIDTWRQTKGAQLREQISRHGKLRAKAFPGRAAILIELLGLTEEHISAVYEQPSSKKVGMYVPGTRIPIRSDLELDLEDTGPILNLGWHIHSEILGYLRRIGFAGDVIPIVSAEDFGG